MDKPQIRRHFCSLRECLTAGKVTTASAAICRRLAAWPVLQAPTCILTYLAFRNEPDLSLLFDLLPQTRWIIPRIEGQHLALHPYDPTSLVRHHFGMLEPAADLPVVDPTTLDVVLVPGVTFDRRGGRVGFGGGYYDRFLPTTPALRVGVTYDECLADALPCGEHDQRMDWIVTPRGLFATRETTR
ncbi:MAG: 5-formyltetrahydrofolate cyclo-ligase [Chloroflexota bacterium]|nr:5-formyltetrahydrofolate cyclo-ligase [Chloroflexota bacterium]